MIVLVGGKIYDSTKTPILIVFDKNEEDMLGGMKRMVSTPGDSTVEDRQRLLDTPITIPSGIDRATRGIFRDDKN